MKKIIFTLLMFVAVYSFAQTSMILTYNGTQVQSGDTIQFENVPLNSDFEVYSDITNTTNRPLNLFIVKDLLQSAGAGTEVSTCLGQCTTNDTIRYTMEADTTLSDAFHITYGTLAEGISIVKYRIANEDNIASDYVDVYFRFDSRTTSIHNASMQHTSLSAYPNPASGNVNINYSYNGNASSLQLVVKNIMGATVQVLSLNTNGDKVMMNVSEFTPGIYFYSLEADGRAIMTKKLLVK